MVDGVGAGLDAPPPHRVPCLLQAAVRDLSPHGSQEGRPFTKHTFLPLCGNREAEWGGTSGL